MLIWHPPPKKSMQKRELHSLLLLITIARGHLEHQINSSHPYWIWDYTHSLCLGPASVCSLNWMREDWCRGKGCMVAWSIARNVEAFRILSVQLHLQIVFFDLRKSSRPSTKQLLIQETYCLCIWKFVLLPYYSFLFPVYWIDVIFCA